MKCPLLQCLGFLLSSSAAVGDDSAAIRSEDFQIHLAGVHEREVEVAKELIAISRKYDLRPWLFTRRVQIESGVIPHSHPTLTLHTLHVADPEKLLAVFLHEQIHWFLTSPEKRDAKEAALSQLREMYPRVPQSQDGGAADEESTYLHLLVNWLEFDALRQLLGIDKARQVVEEKNVYEWIYGKVLKNNQELESIVEKHGLRIANKRR